MATGRTPPFPFSLLLLCSATLVGVGGTHLAVDFRNSDACLDGTRGGRKFVPLGWDRIRIPWGLSGIEWD
ncbi:hypothetical protein H6P81_019682 [Aristolochia fimbriata]|uniref:Uncharacterized protein n=1 Tax=Aristolochia fimbriata TaxID=158543 RepID=A0AAV7DVK2_ARIFI|nr:hypothetical protein H6P81_019682 [Aristolochia fimbriata]